MNDLYRFFLLCVLYICNTDSLNITILHTNDFHGRFEEINQFSFPCDETEQRNNECFGGVARLATAVKTVRREEDNVILLEGGDRFTGTIWSEVYKGNASEILVNNLNYTAITLGNHDFDYGIVNLQHFIKQANCDVVVSNLDTSNEPLWSSELIKKSIIIDISGEQIGIVGYIITSTSNSSNPGSNIHFLRIIQSVQKAVDDLKSKGITKIIALGHAGFTVDKEVAKKVKGVDVVVGGHSNTFLYTGSPPSLEVAEGPYPVIIHPDYNKSLSVPVVQAYKHSKYLGHLKVAFSDNGEVTSWHGNPILLDHKIMKDTGMNEIVKKMKGFVDGKGNAVIGQSKVALVASNKVCEVKQCSLGTVILASMIYHFKSYNATIGLLNGGSLKASLPVSNQGDVFYKDLFNSFPYGNTVDLVELSGEDIIKSLQVSGYLQVKGLRVKYSSLQPKRLVKLVEVQVPCSSNDCYKPINASKIYKVVVNSYLVTGGNHIIMTKAKNRQRGDVVYDAIVGYFKVHSPITFGSELINIALKLNQDVFLLFSVLFLLFNCNRMI